MHTLFLPSNFALCSSILRLCQIANIRSFSLIDSLIFQRMLSASCPPPSFSRSKEGFLHVCRCENCFVRYCLVRLVLDDDSAPFAPGSGSSSWPAAELLCVLTAFAFDASCACPFHASCVPSSRCVLISSCAFDTVSALLLPPSTLWLLVSAVKFSPFETGS